jgi:hypothetical protein|tara:strand:+ start:315 stop:662 length:348 start_codon:yes stop_codon:yes gene_type:complete
VSFEEMKSFVQQATAGSYNPQQENLDEEMRRLSRKVDETVRDLEGKLDQRAAVSSSVGASELTRLEQRFEQRLVALEEQLSDKASKQSVAQALHRKVNKPENDELLAQKADLADL